MKEQDSLELRKSRNKKKNNESTVVLDEGVIDYSSLEDKAEKEKAEKIRKETKEKMKQFLSKTIKQKTTSTKDFENLLSQFKIDFNDIKDDKDREQILSILNKDLQVITDEDRKYYEQLSKKSSLTNVEQDILDKLKVKFNQEALIKKYRGEDGTSDFYKKLQQYAEDKKILSIYQSRYDSLESPIGPITIEQDKTQKQKQEQLMRIERENKKANEVLDNQQKRTAKIKGESTVVSNVNNESKYFDSYDEFRKTIQDLNQAEKGLYERAINRAESIIDVLQSSYKFLFLKVFQKIL